MILLAEVVKIDGSFLLFRGSCEELCEFAVEVRYPGGISEPPEGEAAQFVEEAAKVLAKVEQCIAR